MLSVDEMRRALDELFVSDQLAVEGHNVTVHRDGLCIGFIDMVLGRPCHQDTPNGPVSDGLAFPDPRLEGGQAPFTPWSCDSIRMGHSKGVVLPEDEPPVVRKLPCPLCERLVPTYVKGSQQIMARHRCVSPDPSPTAQTSTEVPQDPSRSGVPK